MITFSVIIPVYNVEPYLAECIDSCLAQLDDRTELILVDDGSTDASPLICDRYSEKYDNISVLHKSNGGLSSARNAGVAMAKGTHVLFLDSDDFIAAGALNVLSSVIQKFSNADIVQFGYEEFDTKPRYTSEDEAQVEAYVEDRHTMFERLQQLGGCGASACTKLIRRDLADTIKFEIGKLHEDEFYSTELLQRAHSIVYIRNILYFYRRRSTSIVNSQFTPGRLDALEAVEKRVSLLQRLQYSDLARKERLRFEQICLHMYYQAKLQGMRYEASICAQKLSTFPCSYVEYTRVKDKLLFWLLKTFRGFLPVYYIGKKIKHMPIRSSARSVFIKGEQLISVQLSRLLLRNRNFSIISNNCWGGIVYQKYGLPYTSPTVGLFIFEDDYIKFLGDLRHYLSLDPIFIPLIESRHVHRMSRLNLEGAKFPVARLGDIEIFFQHYHSEREAFQKWKRRTARINFDNLIVKFSERQFCTHELIQKFAGLPYKNKVCFTEDPVNCRSNCTFVTVPELHQLNESGGNEIPYTLRRMNITEYLNHLK